MRIGQKISKILFLGCIIFSVTAMGCRKDVAPRCGDFTQLKPIGLMCEYRENPCGIDCVSPRFSWQIAPFKDGETNLFQKAYRVLVATSRDKLSRDIGDLWDSGVVASRDNASVEYRGRELNSSRQFFWKVKISYSESRESAWSQVATFTTGIMSQKDWKAKWIGPHCSTRPDEDFGTAQWITAKANTNGVAEIEFTFNCDELKDGEFIEMVHAAVSEHEIDVNGIPFHRRGDQFKDWRYLRFRDMSRWILKGENKIVVRIYEDVPRKETDPIDPFPLHAPKGVRAFLAKIILPNGQIITTGKDGWKSPQGEVSCLGAARETEWGKHLIMRTENVFPAFAKIFQVKKPIASALLHVTGAGFYEASINGVKIGDKVLDPSPTIFNKRILYSTYSLKNQLNIGENELKILVGHGWYDVRSVGVWSFEVAPWRNFPRCIAQLEIVYEDGEKEIVATDKTWRHVDVAIEYDDIYEGEIIKSRGLIKDKDIVADGKILTAEEVSAPSEHLRAEAQMGSKIMRMIPAKKVYSRGNGFYVVDFGENIAGWARMKFNGQQKGDVVSIRYDERINLNDMTPVKNSSSDGRENVRFDELNDDAELKGADFRRIDSCYRYTASHRVCAKDSGFQTDRFICSGEKNESYEPKFVYHGFRYVVLNGLREEPKIEDFVACVVHTAFNTIGSFECSDETFNKLMEMGDKAYRSNFVNGVPTDCPHREKNGWTGDASIASELAQYLYENTAGYEKWLRDIIDVQREDGNIPSIVPSAGWGYHWGNGPAWDSALSVIPWNLWIYREDRRILDEVYPALVKYLKYTESKADADGLVRHGLGDWVPVNRSHMPSVEFTSSCFYYQTLMIVANIAEIKGLNADVKKYREMAQRTRDGINKKCYKGDGIYDNGLQTAQAFALAYGLVDEGNREKVEAKLVEAIKDSDYHFDVGILGAKQILRVLSRIGRTDIAFKIITNPTYPSPVVWLKKGGTTLWEDWNGRYSRNHIMFGDFIGWAYQYLAGIQLAEIEGSTSAVTLVKEPGFKEIVLAPQVIDSLNFVRAKVQSMNGEILSSWKRTENGVEYEFIVPPNTKATICLPKEDSIKVSSGRYIYRRK